MIAVAAFAERHRVVRPPCPADVSIGALGRLCRVGRPGATITTSDRSQADRG